MNMASYELFSEADLEQCPCEFCGEPYPFEILVEHQSGCRPDVARYNFENVVDTDDDSDEDASIREVIANVPPPKQVQSIETDTSSIQKTETKAKDFRDLVTVAKESIKESVRIKEEKQKTPPSKEFEKLSIEDPSMQETGTKLMTYGSNTDKNNQVENEKPSFKVPSLLNNADQTEIDVCISDDEEGESLEEFWKRAEIINYQRLKKMKSVNAV